MREYSSPLFDSCGEPRDTTSGNYPMGRSGYMPCGCRDCPEIAIGDYRRDGSPVPTLCNACEEAGCECDNGEFRAPGAYDGADGEEE